jgi:hypothetical protein
VIIRDRIERKLLGVQIIATTFPFKRKIYLTTG